MRQEMDRPVMTYNLTIVEPLWECVGCVELSRSNQKVYFVLFTFQEMASISIDLYSLSKRAI